MRKKNMKRWLALGVSTIMMTSMLGCSSSKSAETTTSKDATTTEASTTAETTTKETASGEVKTLTVLMYTDWYKAGWEALEKYVNENSTELGFKLEISKIQGGTQGDQVVQTKFATDDLPDIIQIYKPAWVETNTSNGLDKLVDLTGLESMSQYDENALNGTFVYKDKLYGIPMDSVTLSGVFYNKKVFETAGVEIPKTWDEMLAACEKLKAAGVTPVYYSAKDAWTVQPPTVSGMVAEAAERKIDTFELMNQISTNQIKFSDCKNFVEAIERSKQLIDLGYVNETYLSDTFENAQQALADGTCAMYINGTWCTDNITEKFPDKADNIGAFAIPTTTGDNYINMFTPYSLALTTNCKDVELGKKAMNFLASSEAQQIYATAQPGLYLNKNVNCTMSVATSDLKKIMDSGKSMTDWEEINKYSYGNLGEHVLDYYTGTLKEAKDVTAALDTETEKSAKAQGDTNWK
jgi:raffinose/stachyose/melibiose transport system substrate-binding protein